MFLKVPVIAVNSGGPRETVLHGKTGFLCEQVGDKISKIVADAMLAINLIGCSTSDYYALIYLFLLVFVYLVFRLILSIRVLMNSALRC